MCVCVCVSSHRMAPHSGDSVLQYELQCAQQKNYFLSVCLQIIKFAIRWKLSTDVHKIILQIW